MKNIIAVIWDFDKTLVDGYMQDPIFKEYHVDASAFWREVNSLPEKYMREQHVRVNPDTIYLNQFLRYVKDGRFIHSKLIAYAASPIRTTYDWLSWANFRQDGCDV